MLPADMPNTSAIMPLGILPEVHLRYTIPADEKQIVESLRTVQKDLNQALRSIETLTRERDDARNELRLLHVAQNKQRKQSSSQRRDRVISQVEKELFDLSRMQESPERPPARQSTSRRVTYVEGSGLARDFAISQGRASTIQSESAEGHENAFGTVRRHGSKSRVAHRTPEVEEAEQSMIIGGENTAASNTSRRRRQHVLDENMTSEYIMPDITLDQQQAQNQQMSAEAQHVLHQDNPTHIHSCEICQRLTYNSRRQVKSRTKSTMHFTASQQATQQHDTPKSEGAHVTEMLHLIGHDEPTLRPKISPAQALENVKQQTKSQFDHAKERFTECWQRYDAIQAPMKSSKHETAAAEMKYWQMRMEEYRVNLDNLRDVQEGVAA